MNASLVSLLLALLALLIVGAGAVGLRGRRHRFKAAPITDPICPRCRYAIEDASRRCSECGADVPRMGVRDASWPQRSTYVQRGVLAAMLCLPWPFIVAGVPPTWIPSLHTVRQMTLLSRADADGLVDEVLRFEERRWWPGAGVGVAARTPRWAPRRTSFAAAPTDPGSRLSASPGIAVSAAVEDHAAIFGDDAYEPVPRDALGEPASAALPLADELLDGPPNAAGAAWSDSARSFGGGSRTATTAGPYVTRALTIDTYGYLPLEPGRVVPVSRRTARTATRLLPRPELSGVIGTVVFAALLVRGGWMARRHRPRPVMDA